MTLFQIATYVLLIPLASAAFIACFLRRQGTLASAISVIAAGALVFLGSKLIFTDEVFHVQRTWLQLGDFRLSIGFYVDGLAKLMLAIVCFVGFLIHLFSLGYMADDASKARFFGGLSIFMFSMLGIVLADNLFMIFIFWELVGFSSYLLINHYHERQSAADASKKAFIVNRIGDFGFLLGIAYCYKLHGTVNITDLTVNASHGMAYSRLLPLLLFCGALGKSAQMPLHVWLPDAMEGPTPVSALIHAATMVAAGIYMLCRINAVMVPEALNVIMWIGVITAVYAAFCAIAQRDIKKVLAYSTLSQLGYMVAAFGLGSLKTEHGVIAAGVGAAMFHLTTHAFFKALMFLGSGSIIHACHHEQDIFKMGGLRKKMPITFITFSIGWLAIIGFPFLAGFFSKDAILYLAYENNKLAFGVLAFTAILTSFYMTRLWVITFLGTPRSKEAEHAHESGFAMTFPLLVLAALSVLGGYIKFYPKVFESVLQLVPEAEGSAHTTIFAVSAVVLAIGALTAFVLYKPAPMDPLEKKAPGLFRLLASKLFIDELYLFYVSKIQQRLANILSFLDQILVAGLLVRGSAGLAGLFGLGARALHVGNLHAYVYWFLIGAALCWAYASGLF